MPPTMLAPVPTRPRSNLYRRRRGAAPLLPGQIVASPKRPAESSTSASSSFRSVVVSTTSSTALDAAAQRPEKRPRRQDADADEARPAASECSEIIGGGARRRPAEVEASESSCLGSVLACPEQLADDAETTDYLSACCDCELTQSDAEEELLSAPSPCDEFDSLTPLIDLTSPSASEDEDDGDDDDDAAPSLTFSFFLDFAQQFVPCAHPKSHAVPDAAMPEGKRFEDVDDEESYEQFRQRERRGVVACDYSEVYGSMSGDHGRDVLVQRAVMVNWIMEYVDLRGLQPETLFLGVGLMDRVLTRGYIEGTRNLQLLGIACVTLATRIEENQPYNRFYLKAAEADDKVKDLAKHLAFLSLLDHKHLSYWPSTVAASVVALACLATNKDSSCRVVMESLEWLLNYAS
ncbi:hypothetical protein ACQ4PT_033368 [Festuca glaucescens]